MHPLNIVNGATEEKKTKRNIPEDVFWQSEAQVSKGKKLQRTINKVKHKG